ncbi:hypothetical protein ONZ43_g1836 [Nemania bipapillata]|uniref:Uncharacterized protein n=1 Tax=Nemania bipapillata TaxID=110536 RepID=A0ACC2J324_9PEZI|nr:hypothetical protein ONZ43_g1836 [Nemania bipapillata]
MAKASVTRLIICVDEAHYAEDGTAGYGNESNVSRLRSLVATGVALCDRQDRSVSQTLRYHQAVKESGKFARLQSRTIGSIDQQVKDIVEDIYQRIDGPEAELFLYGSGRGAYIVQVIASLLHLIGTPKSMSSFDQLYQTALALQTAWWRNDALKGGKLTAELKGKCHDPPKIQFLGVFDALKTDVEKQEYKSWFVDSVQNFRHALAFNDTQTTPYVWKTPAGEEIKNRSFIQAWFMGDHQDVCGGSEHDGLSLFPLQWMLLESIKSGLILKSDRGIAPIISLAFPQFAGEIPNLEVFGVEMTEESTTYSQGSHEINKAFESPNHPGLLIHDSRGWQAGSDKELGEIAEFLRYRAFQKNPAEALHVIWFCINSDVSRIEEADKRTFEIIARYSSTVPVFIVGTKKDRLIAFHKMELLETYMEKIGDYKEASRLATEEANEHAEKQFLLLRDQLSSLEHYKADGYCCLSRDDDKGIRKLISDTSDVIADERVRVFCVAAQVVDVEQKINQAITEVMRLGTHAIRTAMVPLPASGMIGTPTVSRILCEHVIQCFGFPKTTPEAVEEIMSKVVRKSFRNFMRVSLIQFGTVGAVTLGAAIPTFGIGLVAGLIGCILATPPTARMLLKCACDIILILERSFRYQGKYVSVKQLEDAAIYYTTAMTKKLDGTPILLQNNVHDQIDQMIPLKNVGIGFKFGKLRAGLQDIIYMNRYDKEPKAPNRISSNQSDTPTELRSSVTPSSPTPTHDLKGEHVETVPTYKPVDPEANAKYLGVTAVSKHVSELDSEPHIVDVLPAELDGKSTLDKVAGLPELEGDRGLPSQTHPDYPPSLRHDTARVLNKQLAETSYSSVDEIQSPTLSEWSRPDPSSTTNTQVNRKPYIKDEKVVCQHFEIHNGKAQI